MLSYIPHGLAALPGWAKTLVESAAVVVLRPPVVPSPLVLALLVLTVAGSEGERHA